MHKFVLRKLFSIMQRRHGGVDVDAWKDRPDQRIGTNADPYLDRWFVVPKNDWPFGFLKRFMQHRWPSAPIWLHGTVSKFVDAACINIYLHHFRRSDDDRALHDHPWWFNISWLLDGNYDEMKFESDVRVYPTSKRYERGYLPATKIVSRKEGGLFFRWGASPHRVILHEASIKTRRRVIPAGVHSVWTLFITGPYRATWGFYCPERWIHWKPFTNSNGGRGAGCDAPEEF